MGLATTAPDDPTPSCGASDPTQQSHSVWYRLDPSETVPVLISTGSEFPMVYSLWTGTPGALDEFGCATTESGFLQEGFWLEGGVTYWLELARYGEGPAGVANVMFFIAQPPSHDDLDGAELIGSLPYSDFTNTFAATVADDDPTPSCGASEPTTQSNSVWYEFTPTDDLRLDLTTGGSDYDTVTAIWTGTRGDLTETACAAGPDPFSVDLNQDVTYYLEFMQSGDPGGGILRLSLKKALLPGCEDGTCVFPVAIGTLTTPVRSLRPCPRPVGSRQRTTTSTWANVKMGIPSTPGCASRTFHSPPMP